MGMTAKVRIMAEPSEGREVAEHLAAMPGWRMTSCSEGYANRGTDTRSRWYLEFERLPGAVPAAEVVTEPSHEGTAPDAPTLPGVSPHVAELLELVRGL